MFEFSLSDDFLGLGKIFGERTGTEECGAKPTFAGKGRNAYYDCVKRVDERKGRVELAKIEALKDVETTRIKNSPKIPTATIIIAAVAIVVLILIMKR